MAVRYGQFAIVFLLLGYDAEVGEAVTEGVAKGYKNTVRDLLERKTNAKLELQKLLVCAVELEDEGLFQLLVGHADGEVHEAAWAECMKIAREKGLESMAKMMLLFRCWGSDLASSSINDSITKYQSREETKLIQADYNERVKGILLKYRPNEGTGEDNKRVRKG
ncbi:hypothetical protein EJ07DRAFT_174778 [Lizonia empirigonia]|nr:hypothetical protein EJ07DRAFT_174778 [Lizonia empirigonia]